MSEREKLLQRMDKALERMYNEDKGLDEYGSPCFYYERFKAKRKAVAEGKPYRVHSVAPYLIAYVGSMIPDVNYMDRNGKRVQLKGRGNRDRAVIEVVKSMGWSV